MGQICLILQGVVVGQWLLLTYRQSLLASPGNEKQCILALPLSFFYDRKRRVKEKGIRETLSLLLPKVFFKLRNQFFAPMKSHLHNS